MSLSPEILVPPPSQSSSSLRWQASKVTPRRKAKSNVPKSSHFRKLYLVFQFWQVTPKWEFARTRVGKRSQDDGGFLGTRAALCSLLHQGSPSPFQFCISPFSLLFYYCQLLIALEIFKIYFTQHFYLHLVGGLVQKNQTCHYENSFLSLERNNFSF